MANWVHQGTPKSYKFMCSECGQIAFYHIPTYRSDRNRMPGDKTEEAICPYPYCPFCQSKMEEPK